MDAAAPKREIVVIAPGGFGLMQTIREAWRFRAILVFLTWRDIAVRYKQTALGLLWALLVPLLQTFLFTLIFHRMAGIQSGEVPYGIYAFAGVLPWKLFSTALERSTQSIVAEARVLTKVYFPRVLVPLAATLASVVDYGIGLVVLLVIMVAYGIYPSVQMLLLPVFVVYAILAALSVGIWLSALNVRFRDVRYTIPFLIQAWMFLTPVAYPREKILSIFPEGWRWVYDLNPMVGVVNGCRWALVGEELLLQPVALSLLVVALLLSTGVMYFRSVERGFADLL